MTLFDNLDRQRSSGLRCKEHDSPRPCHRCATEGAAGREEGIQRSHTHAKDEWKREAYTTLHALAMRQPTITSEDVLYALGGTTPEKRAMGGIMRHGKHAGWIAHHIPRQIVAASRPSRHRGTVEVWKSLIYTGEGLRS